MSKIIEGPVRKVNLERLTNCCYAFVLVLLVKNIPIPTLQEYYEANETAYSYLVSIADRSVSEIFVYVSAFLILAYFWVVMYHMFHQMKVVDRGFIFRHFITLAMLVFIPVTSLLTDIYTHDPSIVGFMHVNVLFFGIFLMIEWRYASGKGGLLLDRISSEVKLRSTLIILGVPFAAAIALILSWYDVPYTRAIYFIAIPVFALIYYFQNTRNKNEEGLNS